MSAENELIDLVRAGGKFSSDNALAQKLGVTRAMVSSWRSGRYAMPDDQIAQLCALAKLDGASWMARIHTERAGSATERALWKSILDRLAPITAVVGALAIVAVGLHAGAHEGLLTALSPLAITPTVYTLCEMRNRTVDAALHRRGLLLQPTPQEADWTMTFDTYERVDLTGPWAGDCRAGNAPVPAGIHPICRGHTPHISRSLDKSPQL
ncbi:DUF3693 domain-containing protein [Xanthomonas oryzae pv. oryzae]|uniref:DUF3693 domain-containing protein n=2 Tax=Xanthomonas oryzae TaxID=347 RepID=UPI000859AA07|nr:DUF3693 domain-containing protein [Xanthomonas oryzae]AWK18479.1 hypothetical protein B9W05_06015 [Xanthomonas oryzae pv. oryzae]AXM21111.1 hypothetical protein BRM88_11935 [Xanthomonas oryzae pv. oryzae]AXM24206.1 hypothetical protein BRM77_06490 [Xanthomonas oryzae pv. oryzae]AXM36228.1 hypothetical protein BRM84_11650 [Xanthomonas oryzae pv. oryzae]AXN21188.1 hypothetical protein LA08_11560 [Xanthomonas oryzae pv. oryzae]